jgi:nucleoside-diphosphate-sugar epimerase
MRVLVIGGTGYMGYRILERLLEHGHDVAVVSRGKLQPSVLRDVQLFQLDRNDREAFESTFRNERFDTVIDNIAYDPEDMETSIRTFGGRIEQFILTSTLGVYHDNTPLAPLREHEADLTFVTPEGYTRDSASPRQNYSDNKRRVERLLVEAGPDVFQYTIFRPTMVLGKDDRTRRVWWFVQRVLDGGPFVIPDTGPGHIFNLTYVDDLARAYGIATGHPAAMNKIYNMNNPETFSAETWIQAVANALGRGTSWERVPPDRLASIGLDGYAMPIAVRTDGNSLGDISAVRADLWFEFTPEEEWLKDTAQGCADSPPSEDSAGYGQRPAEIAAALRVRAAREKMLAEL